MSSAAGSDNIVPEQLQEEPNQTKDSHQVMTAAELENDEFLASNLALAWTDLEDIGEREADAFESGSVGRGMTYSLVPQSAIVGEIIGRFM